MKQTMRLKQNARIVFFCCILLLSMVRNNAMNPLIIPGIQSFPDVNFVPVGDVVYAFGGTDADPYGEHTTKNFNMPFWRVFSSKDLVNWKLESEVHPEQTYIGSSDQCWAGHGIFYNNKWYWYLSNHSISTAVVVSESIKGPWHDPLAKPLLHEDLTPTREYDPAVLIDDDGRAYIIFGVNFNNGYHIAELNPDMISLKNEPFRITIHDMPTRMGDAPFLHKYNGKYYLSSRTEYAVSDSIYGPYTYLGSQDAAGHGGFFTFNNQWYVNFTSRKPGYRQSFRFVSLAYVHYRADGTIAPMEPQIREYGVGRYDADWDRIEAEWFFAMPDGPKKIECPTGGFEISNLANRDYLEFPNIYNFPDEPVIDIIYSCGNRTGGNISIRMATGDDKEVGRTPFTPTGSWSTYNTISIPLSIKGGTTQSLKLVFEGENYSDLIHVDAFQLKSK